MALDIIALIFSFASVLITAITLNNQKTDLEFYTEEKQNQSNSGYVVKGENCFINDGETHNYIDTETFLFVKVHIANKSHIPCTINLFKLYIQDGNEYEYKHHRLIPENFCIPYNDEKSYQISKEQIVLPICTIPPLGYVDGYVFFPVKEKLKGPLTVTLWARTARKNFTVSGTLIPSEQIVNGRPKSE